MPWWKRSATRLIELLSLEEVEKARESLLPPCLLTHPSVLSSPTNMCQPARVLGCSQGKNTEEHSWPHAKGWRQKPQRGLELPTLGKNIKGHLVPPRSLHAKCYPDSGCEGPALTYVPSLPKGGQPSSPGQSGGSPSLSQLWNISGGGFHTRASFSSITPLPLPCQHPGSGWDQFPLSYQEQVLKFPCSSESLP